MQVEELEEDGDLVYEITVAEDDLGRVIGKGGRVANAIRRSPRRWRFGSSGASSSTSSTERAESDRRGGPAVSSLLRYARGNRHGEARRLRDTARRCRATGSCACQSRRVSDRADIDERVALRFPGLAAAVARRIFRMPPDSRLRRSSVARAVRQERRRTTAAIWMRWSPVGIQTSNTSPTSSGSRPGCWSRVIAVRRTIESTSRRRARCGVK